MAGLLESLKNIQFQPSAGNMGLLQMGAQMMANSGPSLTPTNFGTALGQGLNGFAQGYTGFNQNLLNQQRLKQQTDPEYQRQMALNQAMAKAEAARAYPMPQPKKMPMGFTENEDGSITPIPITGVNGPQNYMDYQIELNRQKAMTPGFGEAERLGLAYQDQLLQQQSALRAAQSQSNSQAMDQERLKLAKQVAERQDKMAAEARLKDVPAVHKMSYAENSAALKKIDDTISAIEKNPDALGLQNMLGDNISQRLDEKGVPTRAAIAEVGRTKIHDLSGAAVTAAEMPGLMPLIPSVTDAPDAAIEKLRNLRKHYQEINDQFESMYSGPRYREPLRQAQPKTPEDQPKSGVKFLGFE
jgi:hypothetical protein